MINRIALFTALSAFVLAGCNKNPFDRTQDSSHGGGTGTFTGAHSFVIFSNELTSGGGAFEYPGSEAQSLVFNDRSNPISQRSIRYSWTGAPVQNPGATPNPESSFAGFDLMHVPTLGEYASTPGRDLRAAGYTKVTFYARGALSTNTSLKIEVADDGNPVTADPCMTLSTSGSVDQCGGGAPTMALTSTWRQYTITVPNTALQNIKDFFKATFVYTGAGSGQGGSAYFDVIQYQP